jgi:hypothetical protein
VVEKEQGKVAELAERRDHLQAQRDRLAALRE